MVEAVQEPMPDDSRVLNLFTRPFPTVLETIRDENSQLADLT